MKLERDEVVSRLRRFILDELLGREEPLDEDTRLIEGGYLTSLQTVELVAFIADELGVELEPEEVDEDRFGSLGAIATLVTSKRP